MAKIFVDLHHTPMQFCFFYLQKKFFL